MTFDEAVKRYQHRDGFRLADAAEVGLPVYSLNIQAITLAHKRLAPTEEFLLRCVAMQLGTIEEMASYLGLSQEVIKPALTNLAQTENIALTAVRGQQSWSLTSKGKETLGTVAIVSPQERTFSLHFDAILRKLAFLKYNKLLKFREMKNQGLVEIEVFPLKRPQVEEIQPADLERILKTFPSQHEEQRRDILAVRGVDQRSIKKAYMSAIGLLFRSTDGRESQLSFVIDGKESQAHEVAFATNEGFARALSNIQANPEERSQISALVGNEASAAAAAKLAEIESSKTELQSSIAQAEQALSTAVDSVKEELKAKLARAEEELLKLKQEATLYEVRNLYLLDHPPLLDDAISNAKHRLLLISPWIRSKVVTRSFLEKLEQLLRRKVAVYLGYGISQNETTNLSIADQSAIRRLKDLANLYPAFQFKRLGDTHAKVLIKDEEFAAITSFNWLSFKGDPQRTFRDEQGTLLTKPELVNKKFDELLVRFG